MDQIYAVSLTKTCRSASFTDTDVRVEKSLYPPPSHGKWDRRGGSIAHCVVVPELPLSFAGIYLLQCWVRFCCTEKCISHVYAYILTHVFPSHSRSSQSIKQFPVLFSMLASLPILYTKNQSQPPSIPPTLSPWCPYICSLHLCLYFCLANEFISIISRSHIYVFIDDMCLSLPDLLHFLTLCRSLCLQDSPIQEDTWGQAPLLLAQACLIPLAADSSVQWRK